MHDQIKDILETTIRHRGYKIEFIDLNSPNFDGYLFRVFKPGALTSISALELINKGKDEIIELIQTKLLEAQQ